MTNFGKYHDIAAHMEECLAGNERMHTYRVFSYALQILETEKEADPEVVIIAALLHDLGRMKNNAEPRPELSHAQVGAEKSYEFLVGKGYPEEFAQNVSECILNHSRADDAEPKSLNAKILFDADKLDLTGAVGTARTIQFAEAADYPLYLVDDDGFPMKGKKKEAPSLFRDYRQNLEKITMVFYTNKAQKIAIKNQKIVDAFFGQLHKEVDKNHENCMMLLNKYCN